MHIHRAKHLSKLEQRAWGPGLFGAERPCARLQVGGGGPDKGKEAARWARTRRSRAARAGCSHSEQIRRVAALRSCKAKGPTSSTNLRVCSWVSLGTNLVTSEVLDLGRSVVVTFPLNLSEAGGDKEPVHLEGWGIELSVKVLLEDDDSVRDCAAVLRNDCARRVWRVWRRVGGHVVSCRRLRWNCTRRVLREASPGILACEGRTGHGGEGACCITEPSHISQGSSVRLWIKSHAHRLHA